MEILARKKTETAMVTDTEMWIQVDKDTGEPIGEAKEVDVLMRPVTRSGFMITYLSAIIQMIDNLGNKKMQVVKYILKHMDKSCNMLVKTTAEIEKDTGISKKTIIETLKILENANIISRRSGVIMLSPKLVHRGDLKKERYLMTKFQEIKGYKLQPADSSETLPDNVIDVIKQSG